MSAAAVGPELRAAGRDVDVRAVCLGDVMVDVVALLPSPLHVGSDTPAPVSVLGGGSAANTAAWLVAAGVEATFVGRVGDDAFGRVALHDLRATGVDLAVSIDPDLPTGVCIVLVDRGGERTMVPSAGANGALGHHEFSPALFAGDTHLHVSSYAVFLPGARPAVDAAVALAADAGVPVSVDAASAAPLRTFGADAYLDWLPRCLLFANLDEASLLAGTRDPSESARTLAARCGEVIVKLGPDGSIWSDGGHTVHVEAAAVPVVDSTGAGDAFAAGALAARWSGADVIGTLRAGTALAARALSAVGARPQPFS